jgi:hypothetical protein
MRGLALRFTAIRRRSTACDSTIDDGESPPRLPESENLMTVQGALLVGSVNLPDTESTFRAAVDTLGRRLRRVPDGETGDRFHWIVFQADLIGGAEGIERVGDEPVLLRNLDLRPLRFADGVDPARVVLPKLDYARAALESYGTFAALREQGVIPAGIRFQVSLPTPLAVVVALVREEDRAAFEPLYERALYAELDEILSSIPHEDLAIQWDTAVEFGLIESADYGTDYGATFRAPFEDLWEGLAERARRQASAVPEDVELGFHLCYGDAGEKHFVEPKDTANLVRYANLLREVSPRPITWIHLPVPIERDDEAYFAPLAGLQKEPGTELYLGLVHREDGAEGAQRRAAAASAFVRDFGVGTECGIGRAPDGSVPGILETHRVAQEW